MRAIWHTLSTLRNTSRHRSEPACPNFQYRPHTNPRFQNSVLVAAGFLKFPPLAMISYEVSLAGSHPMRERHETTKPEKVVGRKNVESTDCCIWRRHHPHLDVGLNGGSEPGLSMRIVKVTEGRGGIVVGRTRLRRVVSNSGVKATDAHGNLGRRMRTRCHRFGFAGKHGWW